MTFRSAQHALLASSLTLVLAACGGGGSDPGMAPDTNAAEKVALMSGVDRNYEHGTTEALPDDGMTRVTEDTSQTPSGWAVVVDGRTVKLTTDDYVATSNFGDDYYYKIDGNEEFTFWSEEEGGFAGDPSPEFEYLNVYGFAHADIVPGADLATFETTDYVRGSYVYIVDGAPTSDMPISGSATYNGRMEAREWSSDDAVFSGGSTHYEGDFGMTAIFGPSRTEVMGAFSNLQRKDPGSMTYAAVPDGNVPFSTRVVGNQFAITGLTIDTGHFAGYENIGVRAGFYGTDATEVGGVFEGENPAANTLFNGWFAGKSGQ